VYGNLLNDGIYARYLVNADKSFVTGLLGELVKNYEAAVPSIPHCFARGGQFGSKSVFLGVSTFC